MSAEPLPPVRICCGERHHGPLCRSGAVMCQLCFCGVSIENLYQGPDGCRVDICKECHEFESSGRLKLKARPVKFSICYELDYF